MDDGLNALWIKLFLFSKTTRETARRAHHDAFGNDRGAPWRGGADGAACGDQ